MENPLAVVSFRSDELTGIETAAAGRVIAIVLVNLGLTAPRSASVTKTNRPSWFS